MSLNRILEEGKIGAGLDIKCNSIEADTMISEDVTANGNMFVSGVVTAENNVLIYGKLQSTAVFTDKRNVTVQDGVSGLLPLTVQQLVNGIVILGSTYTGSWTIPLTTALDAYIGDSPLNGSTFKCTFINRSASESSLSSAEVAAQYVGARHSATAANISDVYFLKVGGVWLGLSN